jgi:DNA repair ATPase RecN
MALLDRCTSLRQRIEKHDSLRRAHKEAEAFRERANALEKTHGELAAAMRRVEVLRLKTLEVAQLPDPSPAVAASDEYVAELTDSSGEGDNYSRFKRLVDKVTREVGAAVTKALETIKRDLPTIEESFLKQVEHIPTYQERVARIRKERDLLFAKADPASMSPEDLSEFLDRREDLRKLADLLNPTEFPKEVLDFFRAVRQQEGAPLERLTETVRTWLQERDQLKNIRVRVLAR